MYVLLQVYTALISACSREILDTPPANRRVQLVLLERARGVLGEVRANGLRPDAILWNALITAAGRAGQVQGAFQTLEDMQARSLFSTTPEATSQHQPILCDGSVLFLPKDPMENIRSISCLQQLCGTTVVRAQLAARSRHRHTMSVLTRLGAFLVRQGSGCKADAHTYASLVDACARAGRADLAIRVYHKALRERCDLSLLVYASAIAACRTAKPVDLTTAMDIYGDMQR